MTDSAKPLAGRAPRLVDQLTVALFAVFLVAPSIDCLLRTDDVRGPGPELRQAAPRPAAPQSLADMASFPARYEAYWKDSFGLRDVLLRWHSAVKVLGFGVTPDANHVIGKELWIYNDNSRLIDAWRGAIPLSTGELESWRRRIERRRDAVAALGGHYLFAIAPDKPQIYPEYLPDRLNKVGPSRMDQLFEYLRAHSQADVLDLRPALIADRANDRPGDHVYFPLGTHWGKRGAIAGYHAIAAHLRPRVDLRSYAPSDFTPIATPGGDTEAANMYIRDLIPQTQHHLQIVKRRARLLAKDGQPRKLVSEIDDPSLPHVVVFHDSFGLTFQDEWMEACSRLVMVHSYDFDLGLIEDERPDLVFEFIVERALVAQNPDVVMERRRESPRDLFARAAPLATIDADRPALRALYGAVCTPGRDERGGYLELRATGGLDSFAIDRPLAIGRDRLCVRLVLEAVRPGWVALYHKSTADPGWSSHRRLRAEVVAGSNELYFVVPGGEAELEAVVLQPFEGEGSCRLRGMELRRLGAK